MLPFAVPGEGPVADDDGSSPVGVGVETAVPAPKHRLALAVIGVPVSAARAGLGRAVRRNGDGWYAELRGFLPQEFADVADGRLGEAFVEFSLGGDVFARRGNCAASGCHQADGAQVFDGHHLGLGFQQDLADLLSHLLVAPLDVTPCSFSVFGDGVSASFAVTGLAGDVSLMLAFSVASSAAALMVRSVSGADGQVILRAPVCAEDVLGTLDVQFFQRHWLWYGDLDVEAVAAAM